VLYPGDFGYIPPSTLHAYQLRGHFSTFAGPIVPGGWDRFFDLTGEPFATAAFPQGPKGPPPFAKFGRAEVEFKMKYRPDAEYAAPRDDAADDTLPTARRATSCAAARARATSWQDSRRRPCSAPSSPTRRRR
jgi:quercetin 2,3-dioxygenase